MGHEKTYNDYMRSWDKMYSAENLRTVTNHDEEVKIVTLQNLARNLREEAYNRCVAEKPQDLQTVYDVLQKVKQDYETDYQDMLSQGSYPRLETEHEIVMSKLDAQIEQVGWQIVDKDRKENKLMSEWKGYSFEYKNNNYEVNVRNLEVEKEDNSITLNADEIKVTMNGRELTPNDFGTTWAGHKMSEADLLQQSLALYVNGDIEFSMHESIDEFDNIYYQVHEKGTIDGINKAYLSPDGYIHDLQFATENGTGYTSEDGRFAVIDTKQKSLITDIEDFYVDYAIDEVEKGAAFIYQSDNFKEWVEFSIEDGTIEITGQERKTADNKSNSMKEGISMAWGQNTQSQNTQEQKAWGQQNNSSQKEESMAYIDKATREAMDKDPKIKDMAFKMLDKAKEIGADIKEQNLTTKGKDREGNERLNKFVVSVKPAMKYNKETGKDEMLVHKDNSPILAATINHSIGSTTLTMTAKEDMSNGVQLSSISASQFKTVKDEQGKYVQKVDANNQPVTKNGKPVYAKQFERASGSEIQNGEFNKYAKAVAARIMDAGFIKEAQKDIQLDKIPEDQKTPAMKFTEFANNEFKANGGQVMREDGSAKTDAWAKYNPPTENFGETVQLKSNSEKSIVIELSVDSENKPIAKATNFDVKLDNGRFASMYINTPADLARDELKTVPQEIKDVTADFKGFERQREQDKPKPKQQGMEM